MDQSTEPANTSGGYGNGQAPLSSTLGVPPATIRTTTPVPAVEFPNIQSPPPAYIPGTTPDAGQFGPPPQSYPTYGMQQTATGYPPYGAPPPMPYGSPMMPGAAPYYPQQATGYSQGAYYTQQPMYQNQQQATVIISGGQGPQYVTVRRQSFGGHIALACIVFWCCGGLFGIIGFILAMLASSSASSGDEKTATALGKASLGVSISGIIITVVTVAIVVGVVVGGASTSSYNSGSSSCYYYYC